MTSALSVGLVIAAVLLVFVATKSDPKRHQRAHADSVASEVSNKRTDTVMARLRAARRGWRLSSRSQHSPKPSQEKTARDLTGSSWPVIK